MESEQEKPTKKFTQIARHCNSQSVAKDDDHSLGDLARLIFMKPFMECNRRAY